MSTSKATPSRGGGAPPTTPICSPIGSRISSAGTRPISDGAPIGRRTSSGVWRTASWMAVNPKVVVLLAGTNNLAARARRRPRSDVTRGLQAIVRVIQTKAPAATMIVLMGIFPRNDNMALMPVIDRINAQSVQVRRWPEGSVSEHQRQTRRPRWKAVRRDDERERQAPSDREGVSSLGGCAEAGPHGVAGASRGGGSRPAAHGRSQRGTLTAALTEPRLPSRDCRARLPSATAEPRP